MEHQVRASNRYSTVVIIVISLIGMVVIASDWNDIRDVLLQSNWRYLLGGIFFTFLSYTCYCFAYAYISQMLDIQMRKLELAEVCFISSVVNHVLTSGGVVGFSLRYMLMKMYNVSFKETMNSSILHYYLVSLDMLTFLPLGYIYLLTHAQVPRGIAIALGLMTVFFGLVLVLFTLLILLPSSQNLITGFLAKLGRSLLRRDYSLWLAQMKESLTQGTQAMLQHPMLLVWIMILTLIDFTCSIVALGFCFAALGGQVPAGVLLTGYVIGIMAGLLSMIPGGFGIQEGSMTGIYMLLGVRFEQAMLAAILFRIVYYLLPYCLIPLFFNHLQYGAKHKTLTEF